LLLTVALPRHPIRAPIPRIAADPMMRARLFRN
jgi:hypothetical protein